MSENIYDESKEPMPSAGAYVGYNVVIQIAEEDIAVSQRMNFNVNNNVKQFYVVSSRSPLNLETNLLIRGTIRHLYFNTALLRLVLGRAQEDVDPHGTSIAGTEWASMLGEEDSTPAFTTPDDFNRLPEVTISCILKREDTEETSTQSITLGGVKLDTWDFTVNANDVILENVTFFAETISVGAPVSGV
jgi:hypothetical protein